MLQILPPERQGGFQNVKPRFVHQSIFVLSSVSSLNLFSGHIELVLRFIILKRPDTDCLFSIVVNHAVLGHRSTCYLLMVYLEAL